PGTDHSARTTQFLAQDLPLFVSIFISINAALSLIAVMSIYREGGILKRLRATPLRPAVILGAHVLVKLVFAGLSLLRVVLVGRRGLARAAAAPGGAGADDRDLPGPHDARLSLGVTAGATSLTLRDVFSRSVVGWLA